MLKVMLMMNRKPGLSLVEFIEHYESTHVPLAEKYARGLLRYERHYLHPNLHPSPTNLYGNPVPRNGPSPLAR